MKNVRVGHFEIGDGQPPFFVAELGICHDGRIDLALELARAAVEAGAQAVKTETFQRANLVFDPEAQCRFTIGGQKIVTSLADHMARYELTYEEHHRIKKYCDGMNVPFISTAHDFESVDFLAHIGAAAIKIASPDIVHYPLLRYAAGKKLPVFLDTGAALQYEVELAVRTLRQAGLTEIVVNHNPEGHPAPAHGHDLRIIPRFKDILGLPIGLADHFEGYEMAWLAVAVGADAVEKPISTDRFLPEPEKNYSVSIDDLPRFLKTLQDAHLALGRPERTMAESQAEYRDNNRMACLAGNDLNAGAEINFDHIIFGRPRKGIGVEHWDLIAGRRLRRPKKKHQFIQWEDLA